MNEIAVAYYRTSSITNVGEEKDSQKRQRDACHWYAAAKGLDIVAEFYDAAVSGADHVTSRAGFSHLLATVKSTGAKVVLIENVSRFARDLVVQITGHELLKAQGVALVPVDCPDHFQDETPTAVMVRSILGAVSQFEKEGLVLKLRKARERKRRENGRCEGNKKWLTVPAAHVDAARVARAQGLSLRAAAAAMASQGFVGPSGRAYAAQSVKAMLIKADRAG